jgi:hypothetical protein
MRVSANAAALLLASAVLAGQDAAVVRITVTVPDASGRPVPVARHALLVSDNPASGPPKTVRTAADGTVELTLTPGSYAIESERALVLGGRAYEWFEYLDVSAGDRVTLTLTEANAVAPATDGDAEGRADPAFVLDRWQRSVVAVWTPTARASGTVVGEEGLVATAAGATGDAAAPVAVQLSPTLKVPAAVLVSDDTTRVAILRVNPQATAGHPPVALECAAADRRLPAGSGLLVLATELGRPADVTWGRVVSPGPPRLATDITMTTSAGGGPVFDDAGAVVGMTLIRVAPDNPRWHEVEVVPASRVCEVLSRARAMIAEATVPASTPLPVEPVRPFPSSGASAAAVPTDAQVPTLESGDFDVAVLTPVDVLRGRQGAGQTGGASRAPDVAARLGPLTDFGAWNDYFADAPAVVVVRATPKMAEGFWRRVAREAARTQGANLPPMRRFTTSFAGMTLACEGRVVTPIQPFVLEHVLGNDTVVREGLHVFDPAAFDPACPTFTLTLRSERGADTVAIPPAIVERVARDFVPWGGAESRP